MGRLLSLCLIVLSTSVSWVWATDYTLTRLAPFDGADRSFAYGISPDGRYVVGGSSTTLGYSHAVRWGVSNGSVVENFDLGTLLGERAYSTGYVVDNNGKVIGVSEARFQGFNASRGFVWDGGLTELPTFGGRNSYAYGMNAGGMIVGSADSTLNGPDRASYWTGTQISSFNYPGSGQSIAMSINDQGWTAGFYRLSDNGFQSARILVCDPTGVVYESGLGMANAINDRNQVVGNAWFVPGQVERQAFVWQNGVLTNLGVIGQESIANDINNLGLIVGSYGTGNNNRACIWQDGVRLDLNSLVTNMPANWTLRVASGVNDQGDIVGWMTNPAGSESGFVLSIPTPGSLVLLGLVAFAGLRRRVSRTS